MKQLQTKAGMTFGFRIMAAPMDTNGNKRFDVDVWINGEHYRETIPGARKVKNGYRVQAYNEEMATDTIKTLLNQSLEAKEPKKTAQGTVSSTSKQVVEQIREHIIDILSEDYGETVEEQLNGVCESFINWYNAYERRRIPNIQRAFMDWLSCVPGPIDAEYRTYEQEELLVKWLGQSSKDFTDDVIGERYYYLIFREFNKLCTIHNVKSLFSRL